MHLLAERFVFLWVMIGVFWKSESRPIKWHQYRLLLSNFISVSTSVVYDSHSKRLLLISLDNSNWKKKLSKNIHHAWKNNRNIVFANGFWIPDQQTTDACRNKKLYIAACAIKPGEFTFSLVPAVEPTLLKQNRRLLCFVSKLLLLIYRTISGEAFECWEMISISLALEWCFLSLFIYSLNDAFFFLNIFHPTNRESQGLWLSVAQWSNSPGEEERLLTQFLDSLEEILRTENCISERLRPLERFYVRGGVWNFQTATPWNNSLNTSAALGKIEKKKEYHKPHVLHVFQHQQRINGEHVKSSWYGLDKEPVFWRWRSENVRFECLSELVDHTGQTSRGHRQGAAEIYDHCWRQPTFELTSFFSALHN